MNSSQMIDPAQSATELNDALAHLETALITPLVSGELESWTRAAQEAVDKLSATLPAYLKNVLHPQYAEIARSDPELLPRVEQLIAEDHNLVLDQDAYRTRFGEFVKRATPIKKDEAQVSSERQKLEQDGLDLILRIKRQRTAADTWLAEANYRDRGAVD
jgi:hypothetical protein